MLARGRRLAVLTVLLAGLILPASAGANTSLVQVTGSAVRIDGLKGTPSQVEVRYKRAAEAGFGEVGDRILVTDEGGVQAIGADCASLSATQVSCNAATTIAVEAFLGDGDDVMVINAGKADGIPRRMSTDLDGQAGADVIRGGLGDDVIRGDAGRDVLAGWSGDDELFGGSGADGLIGFTGDDTLNGENGRDALFGQKGRDRMFGGPQNDVLLARDGLRDPQLVCGPGKRQQAVTDRFDPATRGCATPKAKGKGKGGKGGGGEKAAEAVRRMARFTNSL